MNFSFEGKILEDAYNFCNQNLPKSSSYSETSKIALDSNKLAVSQNNTIIDLLESLHHKIDKLSSKKTLQPIDIDKLVGYFSKGFTSSKCIQVVTFCYCVY